MPLPASIAELVARFEANRKEYHQAHYNETQTRIDFVNPLFLALGWDMDNRKALSEVQREVIHEDALKIGGTTKAPDYGFRAGGQRRFFLETKKPSVNLKLLAAPAYQLRRYAWTAKLPVSILTNFEEFAVYDGRVIPDHKDGPTVARLDYFKYTEMAERWDEIAARFSHDAVLSGAFDRYAAEAPGRKSFIPVDTAFLARISDWRETLARNIVAHNPGVTPRELNYAVQMIIDRIIFLRISEDRGVETQYRLEPLQNGARVYPRLLELFRQADARYNSGLFHFEKEKERGEPDDITPRLTLDDRLLRDILGGLYGDKNPYVFSIFPADILGQVYEQFLGKVIRVSGRTAEVEDKPEVKKAGGVYYTPTYIVRYIVENTVGKLVEGKTPAQVAKLTILDPACGSGSFLIGAYQFLLDWHLKYYTDHDPARLAKGKKAVLYLAAKDAAGNDVWRLTTAEKKRILLANIYGVDIDTQAVEVTKLSLLLKVLEGESGEVLNNTLKLYQERVLPDLENNIQCGNSLIGPDFYKGKDPALFDMDARLKLNAFDWKSAFPKVMAGGGFDAVIGNPPYSNYSARDSMRAFYERNGMSEELRLLTYSLDYCSKVYEAVSTGCKDLYKWFTYHGLRLSKSSGMLGFIVPNTWLTLPKYADLKGAVLDDANGVRILDLGFGVFSVTVPTCLLLCSKNVTSGRKEYVDLKAVPQKQNALQEVMLWSSFSKTRFKNNPLVEKYLTSWPQDSRFSSVVTLREGQHIPRLWLTEGITTQTHPIIDSKNMGRYQFSWAPHFTFTAGSHTSVKFLATSQARVIIRKTGDRIVASLTPETTSYVLQSLYQSVAFKNEVNPSFVLGLLNSRFMTYLYQNSEFGQKGRTMAQFRKGSLDLMPVPSFSSVTGRAKHDKMVTLVESMLKLHKDKAGARLGQEKAVLQQQIEATDAQIDRLVYDLYGLTEDEIRIVEAAG
jgi:hypothetical protein